MIKISDFLGKPLISISDAKSVGYVSNVWFDGKLQYAKTAEITNDDDDYPERAYVELRYMQCDGDAAVIKTTAHISASNLVSATTPCPINRRSFNQSGKALGHVRDVTIEGRNVQQIICDKATFSPKELLSLSENLCIFNDTGSPIKLAKARVPRPSRTAEKTPVQIHTSVQTPKTPQSITVTRTPGVPVKDYSFLMGKPVHSPVLSGGQVIIPAGTVVNEKIIELARRENKLVQLALRAY